MTTPSPLHLTDEIAALVKGALDSGNIMILAAVDPSQRPLLSFRGSTSVLSPTQLCFWARHAHGNTLDAIAGNPQVAMMYRSQTVPMLEFTGRARMVTDAAERDQVYELAHERERAQDPERKGAAVIVDLDKVSGVLGFNADGPIWCAMQR